MASTAPPLYGLSRDVTLAVLPRLFTEELVTELTRRNIGLGEHSFERDSDLVCMLKNIMTQEYRNLEPDEYDPVEVAGDRNFDTELDELERFQCQVLQEYSQTLSRICPSPNIESSPSTESATQGDDEKDTVTYKASQTYESRICSEACLDANASWNSGMVSVSDKENQSAMDFASKGAKTVTSAAIGPTSELDHVCPPKSEHEGNAYNDVDLQFKNPGFQRRNNGSSSQTNSTCSKPPGLLSYLCRYCDYRTNERSDLMKHTKIHTGEKPFMCTLCDYRAARRSHLKRHMLRHSGEKPYMCDECGLQTADKGNLVQHMRKHTGEKPYKCDVCGFKAAQKGHLVQHMRMHTGEKPYMCDECGYRTAYWTDLARHVKRHAGEKPHECDVCGFRTIRKAVLVAHQRKHTGEKPFLCGVCDYRSSYKSALAAHMKRHITNGKPFSCDQ